MVSGRKKKLFIEFPHVTQFMSTQSEKINAEYREIVQLLERDGRLSMPNGEKIRGEDLFAIRVINAGNVRVFYVYGKEDNVYGIHGYVKKSQKIPISELEQARKLARELKQARLI